MSNLINVMIAGKSFFTILVDSSSSILPDDFGKTKCIVNGIIEKIPNDSKVQIINFSSIAEFVSNFTNDKKLLTTRTNENLKHYKGSTSLDQALKLSLTTIDTSKDNVIIAITDGVPTDNPSQTISEMLAKGVKFFNIGVGGNNKDGLKRQLDNLFVGQDNLVFEKYDDVINYVDKMSPNNEKIPVIINANPFNNEIQNSGSNFLISFNIGVKDNTKSFNPKEIEIEFLENKYYNFYKVIVDQKVDFSNPFEAKIQLRVKSNHVFNRLPNTIVYKVKICGVEYFGTITLDLAWFVGDFATTYNLNIFVDGNMGCGKSSIMNLIFNLFTSGHSIKNVFMVTKNPNHTTLGIQYNSVIDMLDVLQLQGKGLPIHESIKKNINITLVDKIGIVGMENTIDYGLASKGCYADNERELVVVDPQPDKECHAFIFVVSMDSFQVKSEIDLIRKRICSCIKSARIVPILVVTFSDRYSSEEQDALKPDIESLPVEKENIFYITPYIDSITDRDPEKDLNAWKLMKCIIEISQQTMIKKIKLTKKNPLKNDVSKLNSAAGSAPNISNISNGEHSDSEGPSTPPQNSKTQFKSIIVSHESKESRFKLLSKTTFEKLCDIFSKKLNITPGFSLNDSEGYEICYDPQDTLGEFVQEDEIKFYIS